MPTCTPAFMVTAAALFLAPVVSGQFSVPQLIHDPSTLPQGVPVCFADINGDEVEDVILSDGQRIVLGHGTGPGSYDSFTLIDSGAFGRVLAADPDADGDLDLVYRAQLLGEGNGLFMALNQGDGWFLPPEAIILDVADYSANDLALADMDGDGDLDLVIAYSNGGFTTGGIVWYPYEAGAWAVGTAGNDVSSAGQFNDVTVVDLDQDNDRDIVAIRGALIGTWLNGAGTAMELTLYNDLLDWSSIDVADLNNDPAPDLVLVSGSENRITIATGNGDGTWAAPTEILLSGDYAPFGLTVGDIDQDGDNDIVCEDIGSFEWHENDGTAQFQPHPIWSMQGGNWQTTRVMDLDADGDMDLFCSIANDLFALYNDGQQGFTAPVDLTPGWRSAAKMVAVDMDGDGAVDVVADHAENNQLKWYRNAGGAFDDPVTLASYAGEDRLRMVADLDQDGTLDLLSMDLTTLSISWRRTTTGPSVSDPLPVGQPTGDPGTYVETQCNDMDGDGDLDVVAIAHAERRVSWFQNDGTGVFGAEQLFSLGEDWHLQPSLADLDGDDAAEFIFLRDADVRAVVVQNDGTGAPLVPFVVPGTEAMGITEVSAFDVDQDGDVDLLLRDGAQLQLAFGWLPNLGNGAWGTFQTIRLTEPGILSQLMSEWHFDDIDGDTDPDIVYALGVEYVQGHGYIPNLGGGVFDTARFTLISEDFDAYVVELAVMGIANPAAPYDLCMNIDGYPSWVQNFTGSEYQLRGRVFLDSDQDGTRDPGEPPMPMTQVWTSPIASSALAFANGEYVILADPGPYSVISSLDLPAALWQMTTPSFTNVVLTAGSPVSANNDFGYAPTVDTSDIRITMWHGAAPCEAPIPLWLNYTNLGTRIEHGTITLTLDSLCSFWSATPAPDVVDGQLISWTMDSLWYQASGAITINVLLPGTEAIDSLLSFEATVQPVDANGDPTAPFTAVHSWTLECAVDPNDKHVTPVGYGAAGAIPTETPYLDYAIRFQNTGTAPAFHVTIEDALSSALDPTRIQVLGYSHVPSQVTVSDEGTLRVRFLNILLPDSATDPLGSQGYISFRIGLNEGTPSGTEVPNSAGIIFDYNEPVMTNTALSTLVDCSLWDPVITLVGADLLEAPVGDQYTWYLDGAVLAATTQAIPSQGPGSYTVTVTSVFGCVATSEPFVIVTVPEHTASAVRIAPNPFNETTRLFLDRPITPNDRIEIVDVHGALVRTLRGMGAHEIVLHRDGLPSGIYELRVHYADGKDAAARLIMR